jgi:hypothetical protein
MHWLGAETFSFHPRGLCLLYVQLKYGVKIERRKIEREKERKRFFMPAGKIGIEVCDEGVLTFEDLPPSATTIDR